MNFRIVPQEEQTKQIHMQGGTFLKEGDKRTRESVLFLLHLESEFSDKETQVIFTLASNWFRKGKTHFAWEESLLTF